MDAARRSREAAMRESARCKGVYEEAAKELQTVVDLRLGQSGPTLRSKGQPAPSKRVAGEGKTGSRKPASSKAQANGGEAASERRTVGALPIASRGASQVALAEEAGRAALAETEAAWVAALAEETLAEVAYQTAEAEERVGSGGAARL